MTGTHRSWFPGREPNLTLVDFERFWCPASAIAHVIPPQGARRKPVLEFRLEVPDQEELDGLVAVPAAGGVGGGGGGGGGGGNGGGG